MRDAQKPDHLSFNTLIEHLKEGRFVIPDFQREFEWRPWDIRELVRSIFLDYYIGSLLLWKGKPENFDALSCEPIYGYTGKGKPEHIVLDGQQRLTALYYTFFAPDVPLPNRSNRAIYYVRIDKFMNEEYDEAFHYDWLSKRFSRILSDKESQYSEHIFPMSVIGAGGWELPNWVQGYEQYWGNKIAEAKTNDDISAINLAEKNSENAKAFGEHLKGITYQYQISYIELNMEISVDKVCDIFTQINSRGIRLDAFDLINALLRPKGLQLKQMMRTAEPRLTFVETERMNVYVLQVMSILCQAYCSPKYLYFLIPGQEKPVRDPDGTRRKEILIQDVIEFEQRWISAVDALENAINLLKHPHEFGVISSAYLPYVSILPAFTAMQAHVKTIQADCQLMAQRKIRLWYWASVFLNRYSGSVESTSARDFMDVKAWINDDANEPSFVHEFKTRFRSLDLLKEIKKGTSVYNGIFNLFVLKGSKDWITGNVSQSDDLDDHHIVPASWGMSNLKGNLVHTILNRTPLTTDTNRKVINDKLPNEYLPKLIANNGEDTVHSILESHFISQEALSILLRDPFTPNDFEDFIAERQRTLLEAVETLLIKERLDLSPHLRELDASIETIELGLRITIVDVLSGDSSRLPQHVLQKAEERILQATRKNATLDTNGFDNIERKLEYCDLRELQDTITGKTLWPEFQDIFNNKEALIIKFGQIAELRNTIRHSRSVDEITRKEGEVAILWFNKVLGK